MENDGCGSPLAEAVRQARTCARRGGIAFFDRNNGYFAVGNSDEMRGQLLRTTDGGAHWTAATDLQPSRPTPLGIRLLSATEGWIPLAVGAGPIDGGLLQFADGGATKRTEQERFFSLRDAVPTGNGTGWAIAETMPGFRPAVLATADGGANWRQVWPEPHPIADVTFLDGQYGFGVGRESEPDAFMRTADGGATWRVVSSLGATGHRLYFADRHHGWVLTTTGQGAEPRIMETTDGGFTWRTLAESLPGWSSLPEGAELRFFSDTEGLLAIRDGRQSSVLRTEDGGRSWRAEPPVADEGGPQTITIADGGELLETSLGTGPGKTHWLQLSRLSLADGSRRLLGRLEVGDSLAGAVYPSEQAGAVLTLRWLTDGYEPHLIGTVDGGRTWSDRTLPDVGGLDWSSAGRFGAQGNTAWWLLLEGHLLRTNDAGAHWTVRY